ncbi:transferase hexapeptide, partial [Aspergillus sclerotialis]
SHHRTPSPSASSGTSTPQNKPPITAHPSATIADSVIFQGTYPITIDAETVIHPRARIYSFDGTVRVGRGVIIGEKCVLGTPPGSSSIDLGVAGGNEGQWGMEDNKTIQISNYATLSPQSAIHAGVVLEEAVIIDTLVTIGRSARVEGHTKICAGCQLPPGARVKEWMVVWGGNGNNGVGQRRRLTSLSSTAVAGLDGRMVEES